MAWADIKKRYFYSHEPFWGCVDNNGNWVDSSKSFELAVHWTRTR